MLSGLSGMGKLHFAKALAAWLLCDNPGAAGDAAGSAADIACGECSSCRQYRNNVHPDFISLYPEEAGKQIKVDSVRELVNFIAKTAQRSGRKVVILHPAESLNINAANALLKSLEEPSANTVIILVTDNLGVLLPTIRSRCQLVKFPAVEADVASSWLLQQFDDQHQLAQMLKVADNRPFLALQMLQGDGLALRQSLVKSLLQFAKGKLNVGQVAKLCLELESRQLFFWLLCWTSDMVKWQAVQNTGVLRDEGMLPVYEQWLRRAGADSIIELQTQVLEASVDIASRANPNKQLLLEKLLISWANYLHL